jgi:hypothetical protein
MVFRHLFKRAMLASGKGNCARQSLTLGRDHASGRRPKKFRSVFLVTSTTLTIRRPGYGLARPWIQDRHGDFRTGDAEDTS